MVTSMAAGPMQAVMTEEKSNLFHSFHGAAILETGCGGARTLGAVVSSLVNRSYHVKHAKVPGTTVTTVTTDEEFVPAFEMDAFDSDVMAESGDSDDE